MDIASIVKRFVSREVNADGYLETNVSIEVSGREIQIVKEGSSNYCTVFVDGTPSMMRKSEVETFLDGLK